MKDKKERLQIPSSTDGKKEKFCFTLGGIYEHLFDDKFAAHDAFEAVIALAKILSCNEVNLGSEDSLEFAIELKTAPDYLNFLRGKKKNTNNSMQPNFLTFHLTWQVNWWKMVLP